MKIVLAGGSGQLGGILGRAFAADPQNDVVVISRNPVASTPRERSRGRLARWNGRTLGAWASEINGADVVINLAGRSVNCRYSAANLASMMASRIDSTRIVGQAIARAARPPSVWLQMSTATIYAHRFEAPNGEATGLIGGSEPEVPRYWDASIAIARAWEAFLDAAPTPQTRKVALRAAMVMSPDKGGVFDTMATLARHGLGGRHGSGRQFVSWIHEYDFVAAIRFLIEHPALSGAVNLCSPHPLPNRDFQSNLRRALEVRFALPSPAWLLELGAFFLRTETELLLKSRRVVPSRLLAEGFEFNFPAWAAAAGELAQRWKERRLG
jgi:uncharacterized protein (TIGR01777 family)